MICNHCNTENPDNARFCNHCGASFFDDINNEIISISKVDYNNLLNFEEHYKNLVKAINEKYVLLKVLYDEKSKPIDVLYIDVNKSYTESLFSLFDLKDKNIIGKTHTQIFSNATPPFIEIYQHVLKTKQPCTFDYFHKEYLLNLKYSIFYYDDQHVVVVMDNITDLKNVEGDFLSSQKRFILSKNEIKNLNSLLLASFDQVPAGVLVADSVKGSMLFVNSAMETLVDEPKEVLESLSLNNAHLNYKCYYPD
ncbi:MAG: zinc-ribbon domain-containing protein, partial [Vampirovibrionia bacterium]